MIAKKYKYLLVLFLGILCFWFFFRYFNNTSREISFDSAKNVFINIDGFDFETQTTTKTVGDFLQQENIVLNANDSVWPDKDFVILPNTHISVSRSRNITINVDGKTLKNTTLQRSIVAALAENNVFLGRLDKTDPDINTPVQNNMSIVVTRINIEEKIISEDLDFKTVTNTDATMGWRDEKITQEGVKGIVNVTYRITYKNNQEISRIALAKDIVQKPTPQIKTIGTYMKLGNSNKGQSTWYAYKGGLFAASTTIPMGGYAKVTNTSNGKSIVVQINDYGPQGKGRIIDLDKIAFAKIAPLGAGVIGVKVEQVLN